jgi:hypothetical protein
MKFNLIYIFHQKTPVATTPASGGKQKKIYVVDAGMSMISASKYVRARTYHRYTVA